MYDLIYANGDSYTAGSGLAQEMYSKIKPLSGDKITADLISEMNRAKDKCKEDFRTVERQRSYPATLGFFANTEVINNAQGGAGLGNIAFKSALDLVHLSKTHKRILAVIGLTNPIRIFFPKIPNNTLMFGLMTGHTYDKWESHVMDRYAYMFKNEELQLMSVINFMGLLQLIQWLPNVDLILIETPAFILQHADPDGDYNAIKKNIEPMIFDTLVPTYDKSMKIHTGCNHVIKDYHDDLAKKIYNRLWKKKN